MWDLDTKIENLRNSIVIYQLLFHLLQRNIGNKKKDLIEGGKSANTHMTKREFLNTKIEAVQQVRGQKN